MHPPEAILKPILYEVRVQTANTCNGRCICCPHRFTYAKEPPSVMSDRMWDLVVRRIKESSSVTMVSFDLHYEPFTDPHLLRRITDIGNIGRRTLVMTNGTLLTPDMIEKVANTKIDFLIVSLYTVDPSEYRRMTGGLDLNRVILAIMRLLNKGRNVEVNVPLTAGTDLARFNAVFPELAQGKPSIITNWIDSRAGLVPFSAKGHPSIFRKAKTYCGELFHNLNILWDGSIPVCCQDWTRQSCIGHIETDSLDEIFYGKVGHELRKQFLTHDLPYPMCKSCYDEFGYSSAYSDRHQAL